MQSNEIINEFWTFLGLHDSSIYKGKLQGRLNAKENNNSKNKRAESMEKSIVTQSVMGNNIRELLKTSELTKSVANFSLSNCVDVINSKTRKIKNNPPISTEIESKKQTNLLNEQNKSEIPGTDILAPDQLLKPIRDLRTTRSLANFKGISHMNTAAGGRYQDIPQNNFPPSVRNLPSDIKYDPKSKIGIMKSVSLSRKLDKDQLQLEEKVFLKRSNIKIDITKNITNAR